MRECPACRSAVDAAARRCASCGAALPADGGDPWLGRTVNGTYRIDGVVGEGGMGRIYAANDLKAGRRVVLKLLHREYASDPQLVARFQREARAASRLDHPNVVAVLGSGEAEDGTLFLAMEHVGGKDLGRVASEGPLGERRIVRIAAQVLSALAEAHAKGIVHRDLKPENVMIDSRPGAPDAVKVLDFGIAKISWPSEPRLTQAGLVCGTPEYMSPEQARGAEVDGRSDLYAVGVMLYQLATGVLPFTADTPVGVLTKQLTEAPVPARERAAVSPALDAVISRALRKDPAARFASAEEMRLALLACLAPASAASPRRSRAAFWAVVALMAVAAAGGGAIALLGRARVAERRGHPDTISPAQAAARSTSTATPTPAPAPTPAPIPAKASPRDGRPAPER